MCEKCEELVKCPVGEKRVVLIERNPHIITDFYGHRHCDQGLTMHIDKYESGRIECMIGRHYSDENHVCYGFGVDIRHCPYCGEKLY